MTTGNKKQINVWAEKDEITLIEFYRENKYLWDTKNLKYEERIRQHVTLQTLCKCLGTDVNGNDFTIDNIKVKFNSLRTAFHRERNKVDNPNKSNYSPRLVHYKRLEFLKELPDQIQGSDNAQNFSSPKNDEFATPTERNKPLPEVNRPKFTFTQLCDNKEVQNLNVATPSDTVQVVNISMATDTKVTTSSQDTAKPLPAAKRMRRANPNRGRKTMRGSLNSSVRNHGNQSDSMELSQSNFGSANDAFGRHVVLSLQNIPSVLQRERAKLEIQEILFKHLCIP